MEDPVNFDQNEYVQFAEEYLASLINQMHWERSELVLDYGCGPGSIESKFFLTLLEANDSQMCAVDMSNENVRKNYPNPRVIYQVGNIMDENSSFPSERKFDKIFLINVMHFIKYHSAAFRNFFQCTKPEGQCASTVMLPRPVWDMHITLRRSSNWGKYLNGIHEIIPVWKFKEHNAEIEYKEALVITGFKSDNLEAVPQKYKFANINILTDLCCSLNRFTKNIPADLSPEFLPDVKEMQLPLCKRSPGSEELR